MLQLASQLSTSFPKHVAIIMDGNGRWATAQGLPRSAGHIRGTSGVKEIIREADRLGVAYLTLYCFSTENWSRPADEISILMELLRDYLLSEKKELMENNIKLLALGQIERIPAPIREILEETIRDTSKNTGMILNFCISYGGRTEIADAIKKIAQKVQSGEISTEQIDENLVAQNLYTQGMPDPDLIIRTSGECRVSNFLLWQMAYSEIYLTETMWPEFGPADLQKAILEFGLRKRRFGRSDEFSNSLSQDTIQTL